uniref:Uncharacterized protein n=1 Tax=Zea mays TaxID=4577 RepID=A0A804P363_MAIZE
MNHPLVHCIFVLANDCTTEIMGFMYTWVIRLSSLSTASNPRWTPGNFTSAMGSHYINIVTDRCNQVKFEMAGTYCGFTSVFWTVQIKQEVA